MKHFSDNEQTNFIMAVDKLFASVNRLRDVAYADNWDRDLADAIDAVSNDTGGIAEAAEALA